MLTTALWPNTYCAMYGCYSSGDGSERVGIAGPLTAKIKIPTDASIYNV